VANMQTNTCTYILSLEGKDIVNANYNYIVGKNKKYKGSLDDSLVKMKLKEIAKEVYSNKAIFYMIEHKNKDGKNKEYRRTNHIISLKFNYNVREYNLIKVKDKEYYAYYNSGVTSKNIINIKFDNGIKKTEKTEETEEMTLVIAIGAKTTLKSKDLPNGFVVKNGVITKTKSDCKTIMNVNDIRRKLYTDGFKITVNNQEIKMVRFIRSSGSAKDGNCYFIDEKLNGKIMEWLMMGLNYSKTDEIDLAGIEAYISLTSSSNINTIILEPKNILLIQEQFSKFPDTVLATRIEKINDEDRLVTEKEEKTIENNLWDGQSLLDSNMFEENGYGDKGYLLLRNRFTKTAAFQTHIQKFFSDNKITLEQIKAVPGNHTLAESIEDIKLIVTKSSLKYLKYGIWEDFIDRCENRWGVVKYDKTTKYFNGTLVQSHYQLLSTLQLDKTQIQELIKPSIEYIKLLKNDLEVFKDHIKMKVEDNDNIGVINSTHDLMMEMIKINDVFANTDLFYNYRADSIEAFIKNMRKGHILIPGNYSVLFSCGFEMLKASCGLWTVDEDDPVLGKDEVICTNFNEGEELLGCRSPHITMANLWLMRNKRNDNYQDYFNLTPQILVVNPIICNIMERLNSCDFDSDSIMVTNLSLLIDAVRENYNNFLVPTNYIDYVKFPPKLRCNTSAEKAELDIKTSNNLIGEIVNLSQHLNSIIMEKINSNIDPNSDEVQDIYRDIAQLAIMSCLEIDAVKREIPVNNEKELELIKDRWCVERYKNKPIFFKILAKDKAKKGKKHLIITSKYRKYNISMDYLQACITKMVKGTRADYRKNIPTITELLIDPSVKLTDAERKKCDRIIEEVTQLKAEINAIWRDESKETEEKYIDHSNRKQSYIEKLSGEKVSANVISYIICQLDKMQKQNDRRSAVKKIELLENELTEIDEKIQLVKETKLINKLIRQRGSIKRKLLHLNKSKELNGMGRLLVSCLYSSHRDDFISLFEQKARIVKYLYLVNKDRKNEDGIIKIFDNYYKKELV